MTNLFLNRILRAIKIDIELFEEVEKDKNATFQAGAVVVLSSLAAGVGSIHLGASNFLVAPALSLLSWYVWAYVIYFVAVKLFGGVKTKSNQGSYMTYDTDKISVDAVIHAIAKKGYGVRMPQSVRLTVVACTLTSSSVSFGSGFGALRTSTTFGPP